MAISLTELGDREDPEVPTVYGVINGKRMVLVSVTGGRTDVSAKILGESAHDWIDVGQQSGQIILAVCEVDLAWWRTFMV